MHNFQSILEYSGDQQRNPSLAQCRYFRIYLRSQTRYFQRIICVRFFIEKHLTFFFFFFLGPSKETSKFFTNYTIEYKIRTSKISMNIFVLQIIFVIFFIFVRSFKIPKKINHYLLHDKTFWSFFHRQHWSRLR